MRHARHEKEGPREGCKSFGNPRDPGGSHTLGTGDAIRKAQQRAANPSGILRILGDPTHEARATR